MFMSIGEVARHLGASIPTLRRWHRSGRLVPRFRTPGGHRRYAGDEIAELAGDRHAEAPRKTIAYARVSSHDQKADLARQAERLALHCAASGWSDAEVIQDLGSGLNDRKRGLNRLLSMICRRQVDRLVLTHKDRLLRFGADLVFALCRIYGVRVVVLDDVVDAEFEQQLAADVIELMTVFTARLHGSRSRKNRTRSICAA